MSSTSLLSIDAKHSSVTSDICPFCEFQMSISSRYYFGSYKDFEDAARHDCIRCVFYFKCVNQVIPTLFSLEDVEKISVTEDERIQIHFRGQSKWIYLEIFSVPGSYRRIPFVIKVPLLSAKKVQENYPNVQDRGLIPEN